MPFKRIIREEFAMSTDSAGALQIEAQHVRFEGRGKSNVLPMCKLTKGKRW